MKYAFVIGDLHFSNSRPWDLESFDKFINWFSNLEISFNKEDCELILLGDCTEKSVNNGQSIELLVKFIKIALNKFNNLIIIGGNHDMKENTDGSIQYSTQFLSQEKNIKLVFDEDIFISNQGFTIKALPYKKTIESIEDYYNNSLQSSFYTDNCDLLIGHINLYDKNIPYIKGLDLNKFNFKYAAFGHIHQRVGLNSKFYTGSIMPFRKSEQYTELPRCIKVYTKNNNLITESEIEIPKFRSYEKLDFSKNEKPFFKKFSSNITYIYEIFNCDKNILNNLSKDYYVILGKSLKIDSIELENTDASENNFIATRIFKDKKDAFLKMVKDQNLHLKRSITNVVLNLLS